MLPAATYVIEPPPGPSVAPAPSASTKNKLLQLQEFFRIRAPRVEAAQPTEKVGDTGLERSRVSPGNDGVSGEGGSKSGNNERDSVSQTPSAAPADPELTAVVVAWPHLPESIRSAIRSLVAASVTSPTPEPLEQRRKP